MPVIDGRLTCCSCGADLGDAEDPYMDPACGACPQKELLRELEDDGGPDDEGECDWADGGYTEW